MNIRVDTKYHPNTNIICIEQQINDAGRQYGWFRCYTELGKLDYIDFVYDNKYIGFRGTNLSTYFLKQTTFLLI